MKEFKRLIYCGILFIVICSFTILIQYYFRPFFIILIIVLICNPQVDFLYKKFQVNRKIGALIVILIFNIFLGFIIYYLGNYIYSYGYKIIYENYKFINDIITSIYNLYGEIFSFLNLGDRSIPILSSDFITKSAKYTGEGVLAYFIANIAAYFILFDKYAIVKFVKVMLPLNIYNSLKEKILSLKKVLTIEIGLVIASTIETGIGFFLLKIPSALILAFLCGILDILPYVGTIIIFIPLVIYNILVKRYIIVVGLIALYLFVEITRQILEAKFISNRLDIHPLATLIAIYVGLKIFGIIGIFSAIVYVILAKEILYSGREEYI